MQATANCMTLPAAQADSLPSTRPLPAAGFVRGGRTGGNFGELEVCQLHVLTARQRRLFAHIPAGPNTAHFILRGQAEWIPLRP